MIAAACFGSCTPASSITIWLPDCLRISGSETPSLSTRLRMMSTERSRSSAVSLWAFGGTACSTTSRPPWRSSPSVGFLWPGEPGTAISATPTSASTISLTRTRWLRRDFIAVRKGTGLVFDPCRARAPIDTNDHFGRDLDAQHGLVDRVDLAVHTARGDHLVADLDRVLHVDVLAAP